MLPEPTLTSVGVDQDSFLGFHLVCISTRMVPPSGPALDARPLPNPGAATAPPQRQHVSDGQGGRFGAERSEASLKGAPQADFFPGNGDFGIKLP